MKFRLFIFLSILNFLFSHKISAQNQINTDSLNSVLSTVKNPKEKVDFILKFLERPENQYADNAVNFAERALEIAKKSNDVEGKINSMIVLSNYYFRSSNYKKAMEFAQKSKEMSEDLNYDKGLADAFDAIGGIYNELGDYDNSSQYFFKSLKLYEKLEYKKGISQSLGDIGMGFYNQQDFKKALEYFNNSLKIAKNLNEPTLIKRQYNNIAVAYQDLQKFDTAIIFLRKALEINTKLGDKLGMSINIMNIGYNQMNKGNYKEAEMSFQQSLELSEKVNNRLHMAECYLNFGYCRYSASEIDKSIDYFKKALKEGRENNYIKIIYLSAEGLDHIYSEKKDTINAYKYSLPEKIAGDSLFAAQKQKLLSKLELQYTYEKKEFERQLAQQTKNTILLITIFGLISGLIILGLVFSRHKLKSKFVVLEKEKIESELNIKNRELSVNLISLKKKNEMLTELSNKLIQLENNAKGNETKEAIAKISTELRNNTDDKMFNEFSQRFQEVHAGFYEKLLKSFPDLTQNELKLCAFLRLNMSSKDISELTGQRVNSIDHARYRLRKKLGITNSETNLVTFLAQI
jgi:tetratricopeptide (TPR) repeat protein